MIAIVKSQLSSLLGSGVAAKVKMKKQGVKAAVSRQQKERSKLIDQLCVSWGNDLSARRRYFQLS
jgi:hypothetical protein